jgi:hypothetical protein
MGDDAAEFGGPAFNHLYGARRLAHLEPFTPVPKQFRNAAGIVVVHALQEDFPFGTRHQRDGDD